MLFALRYQPWLYYGLDSITRLRVRVTRKDYHERSTHTVIAAEQHEIPRALPYLCSMPVIYAPWNII